jgi:predicted phage replisome organizer
VADKRYYWLKLHRDFFKRHDIKIVEAMPNGKDYVLLYLKLLLESVDHEGRLRFSETIPYDEQMIAIITNTNIDTVRAAMAIFQKLNLVDVLDDQTIFLQEAEKLLGGEAWSTERSRRCRESKSKLTNALQCNIDATSCNVEIEIEKEIEIDRDSAANKSPKNTFKKPTIEEILKYCGERNNLVDAVRFFDFYESKGWMIGKTKMKDWKAAVRTWEKGESTKSNQGPIKTAGGTYKL